MLRHAITFAAVLCGLLVAVCVAVSVRGWFASDYVKTFNWDDVARHYDEWYVSAQGGLVLVHAEGTTLAAAVDTQAARQRAGATGQRRVWRTTAASGHSFGPWLWYDHDTGAHAGVVNFGGMAETHTFECRPVAVAAAAAVLPAGVVATRLLAARRRRAMVRTGHCPACGYDLRASPDRCPECGVPVAHPETTAAPLLAQ